MPYASPEIKRAKQAEYRAKNGASLSANEVARQRRIKAIDPEAYRAKHRAWRARRIAEGREDRRLAAARTRRSYQKKKADTAFKKANVARAVAWRRNLDLSAPENLARRIALRLRTRVKKALSRGPKTASAVKDLGCSVAELIQHLEHQFQPGMTWDNYGSWHIDHIRPLSSYDLTDEMQARKACHFSNLQPLWAVENLRKWRHINDSVANSQTLNA